MAVRILLADDHPIVRQGLRTLLERHGFDVVGEAGSGQEALQLAGDARPDIAVLDLAMPLMNGLDAARELPRISPETRVILLTMHDEDHYVMEALRVGISGYVVKSQAFDDLLQAIAEVSRGATYLSPSISHTVVDAYLSKGKSLVDPLTPRERQALQLIAEGKTTKEIAALMGVTSKTAETYRSRIMSKLGIHGTAGLVRYAMRHGLVQ